MKTILKLVTFFVFAVAAVTLRAQPSGGVTQLIAGTGITLSPPTGQGRVTVTATAGSTAVNSATGTAGGVLVNGTSGSAQTGAITISLPASITTVNSITAASGNLTLNPSAASGSVVMTALRLALDSGSNNLYIGVGTGPSSGPINGVLIGSGVGGNLTTNGDENVFIGYIAGAAATTAKHSNFLGGRAGGSVTTGINNNIFGNVAGQLLTTGDGNSIFGDNAGHALLSGSSNSFFGINAGNGVTTGSSNTAIGQNTLNAYNGTGATAVGTQALDQITSGTDLVAVGRLAGHSSTGSQLTLLGSQADGATFTNVTVVGYSAAATASNQVSLGNSSVTTLLFGSNQIATYASSKTVLQSDRLIVGGGTNVPWSADVPMELVQQTNNEPRGFFSSLFFTGNDGPRISFRKARGTYASPSTILTGDNLGRFYGYGYDGTNYLAKVGILFASAGTVGTGRIPTSIQLQTATDDVSNTLTTGLTIGPDQKGSFSGAIDVSGTALLRAVTTISDATQSTNATTGALVVSGGAGFAKDVFFGSTANALLTSTSTSAISGINWTNTLTPSGTNSGFNVLSNVVFNLAGSNQTSNAVANYAKLAVSNTNASTGTGGYMAAYGAEPRTSGTAQPAELTGYYVEGVHGSSATLANFYGLKVMNLTNSGTITNTYGIYVGDITTGTQSNQAYNIYLSDNNGRNFLGGNTVTGGSITTSAPSGGTAGAWKFGIRVAATVVLDTTQYLQLDVGGTLYKVAIAQ